MEAGKIKIICALDGNGHYRAAKLSDREKVWKILTIYVEDGCHWDAVKDDEENKIDYISLSDNDWIDFIETHCQRGRMEIVEI